MALSVAYVGYAGGSKLYFPTPCTAGTKAIGGRGYASSYAAYWSPDQVVLSKNNSSGTLYRAHCATATKATSYGGASGRTYTGTVRFCTQYQTYNTGVGYTDALGQVALESLAGQTMFAPNESSTTKGTVVCTTIHSHEVSVSGGGTVSTANVGSAKLSGVVLTYGGKTYVTEGSRTYTPTADSGYYFAGWRQTGGTVSGTVLTGTADADLDATAVFTKTPTLSYDANGGSPTPSSQTAHGTVTLASAPSRTGRDFTGWLIGGTVYAAGAQYNLTADAAAVAQWSDIAIRNTTAAWGSLSLWDASTSSTAASSSGEWLKHTGVSGRTYRVDGTPASKLYEFRGVLQPDGSYSASHSFRFAGEDVELTAAFAEKPLYTVTLEQPAHGTARIATSADSGTDKYLRGASVEVVVEPDAGWEAVSAAFVDDSTGAVYNKAVSGGSVTLDGVTFDVTVKIDMKAADYSVKADVHPASAGAIASVSAKVGGEEADVAHHGDEAAFSATVAEGYSFAGWFDAAGNLVSAFAECAVSVAGDVSLFAKAAVAVTLSVEYDDPGGAESCALKVDGAEYAAGTEFAVALGDSFAYELVLGERAEGADWMFDRWADAEGNSLGLPQSGTYAPTAAVSMVALVAVSTYRTLVVRLVLSTSAGGASLADADDFPGAVSCEGDGTKEEESGGEGAADPFRFTFQRTQTVRLAAAAEIGEAKFQGFSSAPFSEGGAMPSEWLAGGTSPRVLLDAAETTLCAWYGEPRAVSVSVALADVCDATTGSVSIEAVDGVEVSEDGLSATVVQGASATLRARPTNGYRFAGWHAVPAALGDPLSEEAEWTARILVPGTFYAKFAKDVHSVCEWEGSDEPKTLTWRSKTYAASRPFSPSACRVDALGYAGDARGTLLELSVEVFSAPDAAPTSSARLSNIRGQDARRLPAMRRERYLQVEVRSDVEVDAVLVGTSMGGLAQ